MTDQLHLSQEPATASLERMRYALGQQVRPVRIVVVSDPLPSSWRNV